MVLLGLMVGWGNLSGGRLISLISHVKWRLRSRHCSRLILLSRTAILTLNIRTFVHLKFSACNHCLLMLTVDLGLWTLLVFMRAILRLHIFKKALVLLHEISHGFIIEEILYLTLLHDLTEVGRVYIHTGASMEVIDSIVCL